MNKISKRITSILIAIAIMISLTIPAFASDINDPIGRSCIAPIIVVHKQ